MADIQYPVLVVGFDSSDSRDRYGLFYRVPEERRVICQDAESVDFAIKHFKMKGPRSQEILVYHLAKRIKMHEWVEENYV